MPASSPTASVPPSGLSAVERERIAAAAKDPDRRGAAQENREEVGAGRHGVVEGGGGVGEQKRLVEPILVEGLGRQPLGVGDRGRVAGALSLR